MSDDTIDLIEGILGGALSKGQSVLLHELIWTVDAQLHLIPTAEEINEVLWRVSPIRIERRGTLVQLVPSAAREKIGVKADDIKNATDIYNDRVSDQTAKLSGKGSK